jgi:minichromosome maintenance protein 10
MARSAAKKKPDYDPRRKWGLQPDPSKGTVSSDSGGATYVVSGHVVDNKRHLFLGENIGREAQARAARLGKKDTDRQLKSLLERDREGMQHVELAREHAEKLRNAEKAARSQKSDKGKEKGKGKAPAKVVVGNDDMALASSGSKTMYSADVIKQLGFDPTLKPGQKASEDGSSFHVQVRNYFV